MEQASAKWEELLQQGIAAARAKRKTEAYQLLGRVIRANPNNEQAWLWLAAVAPSPQESAAAFERVLQLNPNNEQARVGRNWAQSRISKGAASPNEVTSTATTEENPSVTSPLRHRLGTNPLSEHVLGKVPAPTPPAERPYSTDVPSSERLTPPDATNPGSGSLRGRIGTNPLAGELTTGTTARRVPNTAPLSPERLAAVEAALDNNMDKSNASNSGLDLTTEGWPAVLAPAPRTPGRPGGASAPPVAKPEPQTPQEPPVSSAPPVTVIASSVTIGPASTPPANKSVTPPAPAPAEVSGLDVLLPAGGSIGWDEAATSTQDTQGVKIYCANCGHPNDADAVNCERCHAPLRQVAAARSTGANVAPVVPETTVRTPPAPQPQQATAAAEAKPREIIPPVAVNRGAPMVPLLIAGIVALIILLGAIFIFMSLGKNNATPQGAAQNFFNTYFKREDATAFLTGDIKSNYVNRELPELRDYPTDANWNARVQPLAVLSSTAQVEVFIDRTGSAPSNSVAYDAQLVDDSGWKISAITAR